MAKIFYGFRLTLEANRLLNALARKLGFSRSAVVELAIRMLARQEGVE